MYGFHYGYTKSRYGDKATILFTLAQLLFTKLCFISVMCINNFKQTKKCLTVVNIQKKVINKMKDKM